MPVRIRIFWSPWRVSSLSLYSKPRFVVRHSGAANCRIRLAAAHALVTLDVEDDGRGTRRVEGAGLRGMRERIEACDGTLAQVPGGGLHLRISVPAAAKPHDPTTSAACAS